ncbi:MAG TPA: type II toxin-antitoxin system RatA family toxin [Gammaproteobacteria bacterium]
MRTVDKNAIMPYPARAMYQLVADVETYPEFLPWCRKARTRQTGENEVEASLEIARGPVRKTFTTKNRMLSGSSISMHLVDGPFKHLQGQWSFTPLGEDGSKVELHLEFDFSSRLLRSTVGPVFNHIAETMVSAFCQRAHDVYGKRPRN